MKLKILALAAVFVLIAPLLASAQCTGFFEASADGRVSAPVPVAHAAGVRFEPLIIPGHSYSIEVVEQDFNNNLTVGFGDGSADCPTSDAAGFVHTESVDPPVFPFSYARASYVVPAIPVSGFFEVAAQVSSGTHNLTFSITDTTLVSPRWTRIGGFETFFGFFNTTNATLTGTLTLFNPTGTVLVTSTFSLNAGQVRFTDTNTLGVAAGQSGTAVFTHNGPPKAFIADSFMANFGSSVGVFPVKFEGKETH